MRKWLAGVLVLALLSAPCFGAEAAVVKAPSAVLMTTAGQVLLEKDSSGQEMFRAAAAILRHETRRLEMEKNMAALGVRDATERIYETILALCQ